MKSWTGLAMAAWGLLACAADQAREQDDSRAGDAAEDGTREDDEGPDPGEERDEEAEPNPSDAALSAPREADAAADAGPSAGQGAQEMHDGHQAADEDRGLDEQGAAGSGAGDGTAGETPAEEPIDRDAITYHKDIRPLIETHCLHCHAEGGIGPFALDNYETLEALAPLVLDAVSQGRMPPWPARQDCHPLRDVRALSEQERTLFARWVEDGPLEGEPETYRPPPPRPTRVLGAPTVEMDAGEAYVPDVTLDDEYRCFLLPGTFATDTFVTAMNIVPGVREQVHHVQAHVVPASSWATAQANDDASPGLGYTCFGGVAVPGSVNMFSWRPGATAVAFEPGDASFIAAGSGIVIQVHYNNQFIAPGQTPAPDLSKVALWTLPEGALPDRIVVRTGVTAEIDIPAGDSEVTSEASTTMRRVSSVGSGFLGLGGTYVAGEIIGMTPHMHNLGTRLSSELIRADGSRSCMVDVTNWSFEWQLDYMFAQPVPYAEADSLTIRCEYDNSPANQPVLNGQRLTPRDVTWGEGSLDEMCLNYIWVRLPRDAFFAAL